MAFNRRRFTTNMPAGGAFTGAQGAGFSRAQAAAMAGKLEGSYGGSEHSAEARSASGHSKENRSTKQHAIAAGLHQKAANFHAKRAARAKEMGDTKTAQSARAEAHHHTQQKLFHKGKSGGKVTVANQQGEPVGLTRNQWIELMMDAPDYITNMPAGGAFTGAKGAGFSPAQAAAMAGKLEGSYDSHAKESSERGAHAEKTKSKSAYKKSAAAYRQSAAHHLKEFHKHQDAGNKHWAEHHEAMHSVMMSKARGAAARSGRATRNEYIMDLIENCTCPATAYGLAQLITNEPDAIGTEGDDDQVGGEEDDEFSDDDGITEKVHFKKNKMATNAYLAQMPAELRDTIQEALAEREQEKYHLVGQLTANIQNPQRRNYRTRELMGRSLNDLRGMLELIGNRAAQDAPVSPNEYLPLYGAGGDADGIVSNIGNGSDDLLDCPTINFSPRTA